MGNLLKVSYWFDPNPGLWLEMPFRIMLGFFTLLFVLGILASVFRSRNKKDNLIARFWGKVSSLGMTIGFIGFMLVLARQQRIPGLAMPFLVLVLGLVSIAWGISIFNYSTKTIPERRKEQEKRKRIERYLPKK